MGKNETTYGYIPPPSYAFSSLAEALAHFVCALCSVECARYLHHIETHPSRKDKNLSQFLPAYTLALWANGRIDESVWKGRERNAKDSLQHWAMAMIEFNTLFRELALQFPGAGLEEPERFVEEKGLVKRISGRYGWEADLARLEEILKTDLRGLDLSNFITP